MTLTDSVELEAEHEAARATVRQLRQDITEAEPVTLRLLLTGARTHNDWTDRPVPDALLRRFWDIAKKGPTSANQQPLRAVFVRSAAGKERLRPALTPGNVAKTMKAPVVAILGYDVEFWRLLPKLFPHRPNVADPYINDPALARTSAFRNGTLQAAYFIVAARAVGLDCGPMSGFDNAKVDLAFFPNCSIRSNLIVNLGYGDDRAIMRSLPRLEFDEIARIV